MFFAQSTSSADSISTTQENREGLRSKLCQELGDFIPKTNSNWTENLYQELFSSGMIDGYLDDGDEYCSGRWTRIPETPIVESALRDPICRIINSIIQQFGYSGSRFATVSPLFESTDEAEETRYPSIIVKGKGPSFYEPKASSLGFSNVAACFETKLDSEAADVWNQLARMSEYAKQTFIQQPNRLFVRSLVITERRTQLFHFDRSGAQYTPLFDFHDYPDVFIRLVLGLTTTHERTLGLDDSVQWTKAPDGTKVGGTLGTVGPNSVPISYELLQDEGPFVRSSLRGRGTTCWAVKNKNGERLVVKDYWIADSQTREFELLNQAKGLPGVCQMVSYENKRAQTRNFRGDTSFSEGDKFQNRTSVRIVMKAYKKSIENFTSIEELLGALRDAIAAHKALLSRNIIHRDISPNNILLGEDDDEGERAFLIDLDIALKCDGLVSQTLVDFKTGTRTFQSLMVLMSYELQSTPQYLPLYDYLDDLESFFWVFAYIVITYKSDGHRMPRNPYQERTVLDWLKEDPVTIWHSKRFFVHSPITVWEAEAVIDPGWSVIYDDLFLGFRQFVRDVSYEKESLLLNLALPNRFEPVLAKVDEHYARVLGLFDTALEKLNGTSSFEKGLKSPYPPIPPTPSSSSLATNSSPEASKSPTVATSATSSEDTIPVEERLAPGVGMDTKTSLPLPCPKKSASLTITPKQPPQQRKRRAQEAELDEGPPKDVKRRCPPSQREFGGVLGSVYRHCRAWLDVIGL